jgi:hypothetical protein
VPATTIGAIAFWFQNEIDENLLEVGQDLLKGNSTRQAFIDTTVWTPVYVDVDPSALMLKYWDDAAGNFDSEIQGIIQIIASATLEPSKVFGHMYIEYDITFWAPSLDEIVDDVEVNVVNIDWDAASWAAASTVIIAGGATGAGSVGFFFDNVSGSEPPNSEIMLYGVVTQLAGTPIEFTIEGVEGTHTLAVGSGVYVRFFGNFGTWTDTLTVMQLYPDAESASEYVNAFSYGTAGVTVTSSIVLRLRTVDIRSGQ